MNILGLISQLIGIETLRLIETTPSPMPHLIKFQTLTIRVGLARKILKTQHITISINKHPNLKELYQYTHVV